MGTASRPDRRAIPCPSGGSFPSDQAASAFAVAAIVGWFDPRVRPWVVAGASMLAAARVAVRAHYPSDVIGGAIVGIATARATQAIAARATDPDESRDDDPI